MIYCCSWYRIFNVVQWLISSAVANFIIVNFHIEYIKKTQKRNTTIILNLKKLPKFEYM